MALLQPVLEHGAITLFQYVIPYLNHQIRANADDVVIKSGMVKLAERKTIANPRLAFRVPVGKRTGHAGPS